MGNPIFHGAVCSPMSWHAPTPMTTETLIAHGVIASCGSDGEVVATVSASVQRGNRQNGVDVVPCIGQKVVLFANIGKRIELLDFRSQSRRTMCLSGLRL